MGDVVTFNDRLTVIAGEHTRKLEVYEDGIWSDQTIPPIGNKDGKFFDFTSLATKNQLYVFGNNSVFNQDLNFLLK